MVRVRDSVGKGTTFLLPTSLVIAITIILATVLYSMVGGCYYTGPSVTLTFRSTDANPSDFATAIQGWNRTTGTSVNTTRQFAAHFDFACNGVTGHGWVEIVPPGGGNNSTTNVMMYAKTNRGLPVDDYAVEQAFSRDRAILEPCVRELTSVLATAVDRAPDSIAWTRGGIC